MKNSELPPFELGFEGEGWNYELGCLVVPINDTISVLVMGIQGGGVSIVTASKWMPFDDILMAACVVQEMIDSYSER